MEQVNVHVEADVNLTESLEKVQAAIDLVVEGAKVEVHAHQKGSLIVAEATGQQSLIKLRNAIRNDKIRDAARKQMLRSIQGNNVVFYLNKQVAFAGHISFCEQTAESPLGPIRIQIETDNPIELVEWLAQKT
jgi:uncharacterized protein